jgi:hypothetical protein
MPLVCILIYTMVLSRFGNSNLNRYMVYNKTMESVRYTPSICMVLGFHYVQYDCLITAKKKLKLPPPLRSSMYRKLSRLGKCRSPSNSMIYSTVLCHRYIPGIHMSYFFSSMLAGLPCLPSAPGCFSLLLKSRQHEAEACKGSTTRC